MSVINTLTYEERAAHQRNPAAKALLLTMARKKSNLCVSVDVTKKSDFLGIIDATGPYVCLIKTHIDIIEDFDEDLLQQLRSLSEKHDFLIFEDRKFADIGNTVSLQYSSGVHRIASWAHITDAHPVPGPSIVTGLAKVGLPLGRGLLLLAEMSSKGSLAKEEYTKETVRIARANPDFVIGFISQRRLEGVGLLDNESPDLQEDFLVLTPGVGVEVQEDNLGQQYRSPREIIVKEGCDVIIVGRGIYGRSNTIDFDAAMTAAKRYQEEGWNAYEERRVSLKH